MSALKFLLINSHTQIQLQKQFDDLDDAKDELIRFATYDLELLNSCGVDASDKVFKNYTIIAYDKDHYAKSDDIGMHWVLKRNTYKYNYATKSLEKECDKTTKKLVNIEQTRKSIEKPTGQLIIDIPPPTIAPNKVQSVLPASDPIGYQMNEVDDNDTDHLIDVNDIPDPQDSDCESLTCMLDDEQDNEELDDIDANDELDGISDLSDNDEPELRKLKLDIQKERSNIRKNKKLLEKEEKETMEKRKSVADKLCDIQTNKKKTLLEEERIKRHKSKYNYDKDLYKKFVEDIKNGKMTHTDIPSLFTSTFEFFDEAYKNNDLEENDIFQMFEEEFCGQNKNFETKFESMFNSVEIH